MRYRLSAGGNHDLTTGVDFSDPQARIDFLLALAELRALILVSGPPCTAFGPWSFINQMLHPYVYQLALVKGLPLANLAAQASEQQASRGLFYLIENPQSSRMWALPSFQRLMHVTHAKHAILDQCQVGLVDPAGKITRKATRFISNSETVLKRLRLRCDGSHEHQAIEGSVNGQKRSRFAQAWPRKLCELICQGIAELKQLFLRYPPQSFIQAYPELAAAAVCPGCKAHAYRGDPRHSRTGTCKFKDDVSEQLTCAACLRSLPSHHPKHSRLPGECRWADAGTRASSSRSSSSGMPRVPVSKAPEEASADAADSDAPPAALTGRWTPETDPEVIQALERVRDEVGWHTASADWLACVNKNARYCRNPEPRYASVEYPLRSTWAHFDGDHVHAAGAWWNLEQDVDYKATLTGNAAIGYAVPTLIHVFNKGTSEGGLPSDRQILLKTFQVLMAEPTSCRNQLSRWNLQIHTKLVTRSSCPLKRIHVQSNLQLSLLTGRASTLAVP